MIAADAHGEARALGWIRALAAFAFLTAAVPGCCITGGWHECDSTSYVGGCDGQRYSVCFRSSGSWSGEYEEIIEGECAANDVCIAPSPNQAGCVAAPARPCDPDNHVERCDGNTPVICTAPTSWIFEEYEVHVSPCESGTACVVTDGMAGCQPVP